LISHIDKHPTIAQTPRVEKLDDLPESLSRIERLGTMNTASGGEKEAAAAFDQLDAFVQRQTAQGRIGCRDRQAEDVSRRSRDVVDHLPRRTLFER
jgi:hypothetical protein